MPAHSRFGLNLLALFVLFLVLGGIAGQLPPGLSDFVSLAASFTAVLLLFGCIYGFFRLIGMRSDGLETFYQRFPLGMLSNEVSTEQPRSAPRMESSSTSDVSRFDWNALCSFRALRYAGIVLIVSAIFSLLFTIEWTLLAKIVTAGVLGLLALAAAEWALRTRRTQAASILSLVSFALLQASLTFLALYAIEQGWQPFLQSAHTWLVAKFLLTCVFLYSLHRYPSDIHPIAFFTIAYAAPLMLIFNGLAIQFPIGLVFLLALAAICLPFGYAPGRAGLWLVSAAFSTAYVYLLFAQDIALGSAAAPLSILALMGYAMFFIVHLVLAASRATSQPRARMHDFVHLIAIHVFMGFGIQSVQQTSWFVNDYLGFFYLGMALLTFCAYMATHQRVQDRAWNELVLNLCIIFSALGLFLQTTGPWSAVIFLLYACGILWYSLFVPSLRTRIYGFLILGVSIMKLYFQFTEIFRSIPGSIAILAIGGLLVFLSYKFEAVKDAVLHGIHPQDRR